ncbi:MAG: DUF167 domain-containing protein [bacterium]
MKSSAALNPEGGQKATVSIRVQPNASKNEVVGLDGEIVKVKIAAPPVDDKANAACIQFFSKLLRVPKSHICIMRGHKSRLKIIHVVGMSQDRCLQRLGESVSEGKKSNDFQH